MSNRIPTTDEVRDAAMNSGNWEEQILPTEFDRWLAEVKAERDKHIISLIKKDCEHAKFGDYCIHDHLIGEIEAQL